MKIENNLLGLLRAVCFCSHFVGFRYGSADYFSCYFLDLPLQRCSLANAPCVVIAGHRSTTVADDDGCDVVCYDDVVVVAVVVGVFACVVAAVVAGLSSVGCWPDSHVNAFQISWQTAASYRCVPIVPVSVYTSEPIANWDAY